MTIVPKFSQKIWNRPKNILIKTYAQIFNTKFREGGKKIPKNAHVLELK